jgi:hypothetical protein
MELIMAINNDAESLANWDKENLAFLIKTGQIKDPKPAVSDPIKDKE